MCGGGGGGNEVIVTQDMIVQQQINAKLWDYYQKNYKPMIEKYSQKTVDPQIAKAEERQVAGKINAEIMKNVKPANATDNPVKNARKLSSLSEAGTEAQIEGKSRTRTRQIGEIQNIINIGRGQAAEAQEGLSQIAEESIRQSIRDKEFEEKKNEAFENSIGTMVGTGAAFALKKM